jgi:peptidoglycan/LPS O-acetylase OafA/YrhL
MSSARGAGRTNNFDTLRLIFAVLVIFSHSYPLGRGSNDTEPLSVLTHGEMTFGSLSVWAFFIISGFLITQSWMRSPSPGKFLRRRVGRIYPGFIVAALFGALVIVPLAADPHTYVPVSLANFLWQTLRLQIFSFSPVFVHNASPNILNGSLWSVAFEFWCYLGVLLLGVTGMLRRRWLVVLIFAAVIGWHLYLAITGWVPGGKILGQIFGFPLFWAIVLPFFLAGAIFHLFGGPVLLRRPLFAVAAVLLIASNFIPHAYVVTLPTCGAYLLLGLAYLPLLHPLNLGRFGDFSYGTYLYAFPIEQLIVMHGGGSMTPAKLFFLAAPIALAAGALSWFLVERRFLSRGSVLKHEGLQAESAPSSRKTMNSGEPETVSSVVPASLPARKESYAETRI